ncbi:hypothetical protein PVAND_016222 [Polypedilum vanderplanki]|uniref:Uncharacterized protein n=1 Tax=Polypedilum vanderplanki TaxID=319348 RepID=A0A9J6BFL3_POLVA|nr:hypothetical protein PVAND_016222 [Polypedilum vanderplanki]
MQFLRFFLLFIPFVSAVIINCEFKTYTYSVIGSVYECILNKDPSIISPNIVITSANGTHYNSSMNHEKVASFYSNSKTIHYMPHELNKIFPNLIAILIHYGRIKEIHQKDLEQYSKLRLLNLYQNDITYLEKDFFKFNTQLQYISFSYNKINQIYPTIFDHLNQVEFLRLESNQCVNKNKYDRSGVLELIKEVKENCFPKNLSEIEKLQIDLNEKISINFDTIKNQLNEKSSNLESKMENLMNKQDEKLKKSESNLNQKVESTAKKITDEIQTLMKQQEKNLMTKLDERFTGMDHGLKEMSQNTSNLKNKTSQKLVNLEKSLFHTFFFIALPLICLFTFFNIVMIYLCCRKYCKFGKRQKSSPSNDVELEERNL